MLLRQSWALFQYFGLLMFNMRAPETSWGDSIVWCGMLFISVCVSRFFFLSIVCPGPLPNPPRIGRFGPSDWRAGCDVRAKVWNDLLFFANRKQTIPDRFFPPEGVPRRGPGPFDSKQLPLTGRGPVDGREMVHFRFSLVFLQHRPERDILFVFI